MFTPRHRRFSPLRMLAAAGLAALLAGSAACSSGPKLTPVQQRAAAVPVHGEAYSALGYRLQWRGFPTMLPGETVKFVDILGDVVVVQESGSVVSVLEVSSGARRWSDQAGNPLTKFVGNIRDGRRLMVSSQSELFFYDIDSGTLLDKQQLDRVVDTRPVLIGDVLVYGASSGQILGHLRLNGYRFWGSALTGAIETDPIEIGQSGTVGLVSNTGEVLLADGQTGFGRGRTRIYGGPGAAVAASDTLMFVASTDHSLYAIVGEGGTIVWRIRTDAPLRHAPTYHEGRVYCDMGRDGLCAFDASTGERFWSAPDVHGTVVAIRSGRPVVWNSPRAVLLDKADGSVVESVTMDKISMLKADKLDDGDLYAVSANGVVARLVPKN